MDLQRRFLTAGERKRIELKNRELLTVGGDKQEVKAACQYACNGRTGKRNNVFCLSGSTFVRFWSKWNTLSVQKVNVPDTLTIFC